jgi:hypothetical protein
MRKNNKLLHKYEFKILFNGMVIRDKEKQARNPQREQQARNHEQQARNPQQRTTRSRSEQSERGSALGLFNCLSVAS